MEQRNQLAKTESKPLKIGEQIKHEIVSGTPIRSLQNVEPLNQSLRRVFVLIGLRSEQFPTKEETQVLVDFCRRRLGNYTASEIVYAFEMAIIGQIKADTEHFGQFTPKYLASVLNAYTEYRNRIAREVEEQKANERKKQSEEEIQAQIDAFLNEAKELYKASKGSFEGSKYHANVLYDLLKEHYTREKLIDFKQKAGAKMQADKAEFKNCKRRYLPIPDYLKNATFTQNEWRRQTALLVVNDAITKNISID